MWIKLSTEYVNLDHIIRVRVSKTFRAGQDEWAVELEAVVKGEMQYLSRYRGLDAEILINALNGERSPLESAAPTLTYGQAMAGTVHDVKIP